MKAWKNAEKPPEGLHEKERIEALDTRKRDNVFHDRNDIFTIKEKGKQMKWRLVVYDKGQKAVLECYDAGILSKKTPAGEVCDFYDKTIVMEGHVQSLYIKPAWMCGHGGIPCSEYLQQELPAQIPVVLWKGERNQYEASRRDRDEKLKSMTFAEIEARFGRVEMWMSDARVLYLTYCCQTPWADAEFWERLTSPIPSVKRARGLLEKYDLWKPFAPVLHVHSAFYDQFPLFLGAVYAQFSPAKQEILKAIEEVAPRLPLQEIKVVGVFAIEDKAYVLRALKTRLAASESRGGIPVTFEREPKNAHDPNAIRVKCVISGEVYKLGYISKVYAEKFAPMMDKGLFLNGAIGKDGIEGQGIKLKVTCRKGTGAFDCLSIVWGSIFEEWHEAEIDVASRTLSYSHRERYFSGKHTKIKLTFSPDQWESFVLPTLARCAFKEWSQAYRSIEHVHHAHLWRMVIQNGETEHRSYGCNRYPIEWRLWQTFINACLDFNDPKGSAVITVKEKEK